MDVLVGMLTGEDLQRLADTALASRPQGSDPLVIADELGFELLPTSPNSRPEIAQTTASRLVFAALGDPGDRVRLALACGLLLRDGRPHGDDDVHDLARRLRQIP